MEPFTLRHEHFASDRASYLNAEHAPPNARTSETVSVVFVKGVFLSFVTASRPEKAELSPFNANTALQFALSVVTPVNVRFPDPEILASMLAVRPTAVLKTTVETPSSVGSDSVMLP